MMVETAEERFEPFILSEALDRPVQGEAKNLRTARGPPAKWRRDPWLNTGGFSGSQLSPIAEGAFRS
jgi:hypothetical protein